MRKVSGLCSVLFRPLPMGPGAIRQRRRWAPAALLLCAASLLPALHAQTTLRPRPRILERIDNARRTVLPGGRPAALRNATDLGRLDGNTSMDHMVMLLNSSPEQQQALESLLSQQLDRTHPNYHRWLTPAEFGSQFGVDDTDLAQLQGWLTSQGLRVERIGPGKRFVQFSGNASAVESAFGTEMHRYRVNGQLHTANSSDLSVPQALRNVVHSVPTLNDFFSHTNFQDLGVVSTGADADSADTTGRAYVARPGPRPNLTYGSGSHYLGAADFATVYNTAPLLSAGIDGTGVSIAILGRTNINLADVQTYRTIFGLKGNDPTFVYPGEAPSIVAGDDGESYLDVEVSGGVAPGAAIKFVTARSTLTVDGVDLAAIYAVENNLADIISFSYGQCEVSLNLGGSQLAFYNSLWQQAAAQGQSVFVSTGDAGPAGCDSPNSNYSTNGYAVNGLASTPYNVAVGGTLFAEGSGTYWSSTANTSAPFSSALGYIPEIPWNEARNSGATGASALWSGGGGISSYYTTPSWQRGYGVPTSDPAYPNSVKSDPTTFQVTGPHRYLPDVSLAAAAQHDGTVYCAEGICQLNSNGTIANFGVVGGTSVAAPTMAGVQALIDQQNGGRQGLPNYIYYGLANAQHTAGLNCTSSSSSISGSCAFHDITSGNTLVCANSGCSTKLGWTAAGGYDLATGLGTPNAYQLATQWSSITFRSSSTTLSVNPTTGITHGQSVTLSGSVTPASGTGTPTGQVAFLVSSGAITDPINSSNVFQSQVAVATLNGSGNYTLHLTTLPAGTYTVTARYGGDSTFGASTSTPVQVTIASESSTVTLQTNSFNGSNCTESQATTFTYGSIIWTDITVAGASNQGVPTGSISVTDNTNPLVTTTLNSTGVGHFLSGAIASTSCIYGYTSQDAAPLTGGVHVLRASYAGDSTFGSGTSLPVTVTINQAPSPGNTLTSSATNISSGGSVQFTLTLNGLSNAGPGTLSPSGTITFTDNTTSTTLGTATLSPASSFGAVATFTTTGITTSGAHSIVASWPGDANYSSIPSSSAVTVTVGNGTATTVTVTSNRNPATAGGTMPTWTATMTPTTVTSGTVNFFLDGLQLGTGTVGSGHTATYSPAASSLPAGAHTVTAVYAGNTTYSSSTSAPLTQNVSQATTTLTLTAKTSGSVGESFGLSAVLGLSSSATPALSSDATATFTDTTTSTVLGSAPFTTVSSSSGGYGIYQSQFIAPGLAVGTHAVVATLNDTSYTATSNTQTITVNTVKTDQTITFAAIPTHTYLDPDFSVSATASSGLTVTFAATGNCSLLGGTTVHIVSAGSCTITASQAGNATYNVAPSVPQSFAIQPAAQTITFAAPADKVFGTPDFTVSATSSANLTVTVNSITTSICTITGNTTVHLVSIGTCTLLASQNGNSNYNAAVSVQQSFNITPGSQTITFSALPDRTYGSANFLLTASASSGLTVSFAASGNCSVAGTTVHITDVGSCTITASQSGNTNYTAATDVLRTFNITQATQTITFAALAAKTYTSPDFNVSATTTSGLAVSFAATGSCSVTGTLVHINDVGSCTITASQSGNTDYLAATSVPQSFNITQATQTITFAALPTHTYGDADFPLSASATSGLAVNFAATGNCSVAANTVHLTGGGSCTITASQSGNTDYLAATSVPQSFTINPEAQTITFAALPGKTYGDADFSVSASATSGLAVSFAATGNCSLAANTVHLTGGGSCTITASQAGNTNYAAATPVPESFNITQATQTITFAALPTHTYGDADFSVSATATSGLSVSFAATGNCSLAANTVHLTGGGSCTITASQAGNTSYAAATPVPQSFTIAQGAQTITFAALPGKTYGDADFSVSATATSGLSVTFAATGNCTLSANTLHLTAAGSCTVTASQSGNTDYLAATSVPQGFNIAQATQTITFAALPTHTYGDADFPVSATATSSLTVSFAATGNCTLSANTLHLTGAGSCTVTASQSGNTDYLAATSVPQSFTINPEAQTITFAALPTHTYGDPDFTVSATATSNLTVSFAATGNCSLATNTVHLTAAGSCTITASQSGNTDYAAATPVPQSFTINPEAQTITFAAIPDHTYGDADFPVSATSTSGLTVSFAAAGNCTLAANTVHLTNGGSCTITASQSGNANYAAATSVPRSFNIAATAQTITFAALPAHTFGDADFPVSATATSGLTVTFAATGNCSLSANTVHITAAGSCTVTASQSGSAGYAPAPSVPRSFNIAQAAQTITFATIPNHTLTDPDFPVSATATSGLSVTFAASGNCSLIGGNTIHLNAIGSCTVTASQAGNANYLAATSVPQSFNIAQNSQTITFAPLTNHTFGDPDFAVSATATSSLAVTFSSTGACSVTGNLVHLTGGGSCTITAMQAGNSNYGAAPDVPQSFSIAVATQTITFAPLPGHTFGDADFALSATATSGLSVTFSATGNCSVSSNLVHLTAAGSCTITAAQPGNASYSAATPVPQSFAINPEAQTITFAALPNHSSTDADFAVSATATSGLAVSFSASGNCTLSASTVHLTGTGSCTITASQPGDANYLAAVSVPQTFTIAAATQTITFAALPARTFGDPDFTVSATTTSSLTVSFAASGNCTLSANTVHLTGAGSCAVTASQPGNSSYAAATPIVQSFPIAQTAQSISFAQPASPIVYGSAATLALTATGGASGNPISFSVTGPATLSGNTLTITAAGTITITASQAGNSNDTAATPVSRTVIVNPAASTLGVPTGLQHLAPGIAGSFAASIAGQYSGAGIAAPTGQLTFSVADGLNTSTPETIAQGSATWPFPIANALPGHTYTVTVTYSGDANYAAAAPATFQVQIGQVQPSISWSQPATLPYGNTLASVLNAVALNGSTPVPGTYSYTATPAGGSASAVTAATSLPLGIYTLAVTFTPTDTVAYTSASGSVTLVVGKAIATLALTSSANPILLQGSTTLTATLTSNIGTPTGSITFLDGGNILATVALSPSGIATLAVNSLAAGTHSLTALYSGDATFSSLTSQPFIQTIEDFGLSLSSSSGASITVTAGGHGTYILTLSPIGASTFLQSISFSLSGLPSGATYTFSPTTIPAGAGTTDVLLTVTVPAQTTASAPQPHLPGSGLSPIALGLLLLPFSRRIRRSARRNLRLLALLIAFAGIAAGLTGCGSGQPATSHPATTYNLTLTATSGSLQRSANLTLIVD